MIQIRCECGRELKLDDRFAGRPIQCTQCGRPLQVPQDEEIIDLLKKAGADAVEVAVEPEVLNSYAGLYKNEQVGDVTFEIRDGKLAGRVGGQGWFTTSAISKNSFAIIEVEATITFNTEGDKVTGFALSQGGANFVFKRVENK